MLNRTNLWILLTEKINRVDTVKSVKYMHNFVPQ